MPIVHAGSLRHRLSLVIVALGVSTSAAQDGWEALPEAPEPERHEALTALEAEAEALGELATTEAARCFLDQVKHLPEVEPREILYERVDGHTYAFTMEEGRELSDERRERLKTVTVDSGLYYSTMYGSPLAYLRAIDLAAEAMGEGFTFDDARVLDLGYGQIGQLRLMAMCGADVVGVEVDRLLQVMYSEPDDSGRIGGDRLVGRLHLVHGIWPGEEGVRDQVAGGYDIIFARNVLKRGYIRPTDETPDWAKVDLGINNADVPKALFDALAPGGVVMVYNIGSRPRPEGYIAATDIADPWSRAEWEGAGFEVVAHDRDESESARRVGKLFGWDGPPFNMALETDLFGSYTLVRRPR
ncbi:MAG: hypothetical protein CMJ31_10230 [Phycisphaerae bacterium]|nr:hypothetical protein [Phycisphaerae bacterium]